MARKKRKAAPRSQARHFGAEFQIPPAALRLAVPALVVLFSAFAWLARGVHEDGFFYLRVVDVFLHSGDLSYNPGERYETNTDFLWTFLLMPGPAAGVDGILWMHIVSVLIYAAALWATFSLAKKLFSDSEAALIALILLAGHYSFTHFAATGFGVVLQALAMLLCLLALLRFGESATLRSGAALGFALLFLALCRLDSIILGIPIGLCALFLALRRGKGAGPEIALALGIPALGSILLLLWKLSYYGDIFPAPYYNKAVPREEDRENFLNWYFSRGAAYLLFYWKQYFLWVLAAAATAGAWRLKKARKNPQSPRSVLLWTMGAACVLHSAYMIRVGGDLYEFRLLMPQAPLLMILAAGGFCGLSLNWRWAATAGAVVFSVLHWQTPSAGLHNIPFNHSVYQAKAIPVRLVLDGGIRSEIRTPGPGEQSHAIRPITSGFEGLRDLFAPLGRFPPEVKIGVMGGGINAYLAPNLRMTEMHGYTDSRIGKAKPEDVWYYGPGIGHSVIARPELLARIGVNMMLHQDFLAPNTDFLRQNSPLALAMFISMSSQHPSGEIPKFPPDSQVFVAPTPDSMFVPVLYFNRNEVVDRILDDNGIERVNVF